MRRKRIIGNLLFSLLITFSVFYGCGDGDPESREREPESSTSPGVRMSSIVKLNDSSGVDTTIKPLIGATLNGRIYVVWAEEGIGPERVRRDVYFDSSEDWGETWQATPTRLNADEPNLSKSSYPTMTYDEKGNVYVCWHDKIKMRGRLDYGRKFIRVAVSRDYGKTWKKEPVVVNREASAFIPSIDTDGEGRVYVVWNDERYGKSHLFFNRYVDYGETWLESDVKVDSDLPESELALWPKLAAGDDGFVTVAWIDRNEVGAGKVYVNFSQNTGLDWLEEDLIIGNDYKYNAVQPPQVRVLGKRIFLLWPEWRNGPEEDIYFNRSKEGGSGWLSKDVQVSSDTSGNNISKLPLLEITSSGYVYAAWQDGRNGAWDIYFNRSFDMGEAWLPGDTRIDVGDEEGYRDSFFPDMATDAEERVFLVWLDTREGRPGIFLNYSTDRGETWLDSAVRVNKREEAESGAYMVSITAVKGKAFIAWTDNFNEEYHVFFRRIEAVDSE